MSGNKKLFVGGNFKAAANFATAQKVVDSLNACGELPSSVDVVIAPTALHTGAIACKLRPEVKLALQDIHVVKGYGAYTGAHTAELVKDFGLAWALTGHSERRTIFGETDAESATKTKVAIESGLSVIFCIGESLAEREANQTLAVVCRQLAALADAIPQSAWASIVVAYEPVWAIGTGKVATKEQAQEAHAEIRKWIAARLSTEVSEALRIVYGGSVNGANAAGLIAEKDIDGFLIGGASLKPEFIDIIKAVGAEKKQ